MRGPLVTDAVREFSVFAFRLFIPDIVAETGHPHPTFALMAKIVVFGAYGQATTPQ